MDFHLPELGEGVYEAEMSRWLVKEGDEVKPGQGLLEVLTDKATMEVPAPFAGTIESFKFKEGQTVKIGDVVLAYREKAGHADEPSLPKVAEVAVESSKPAPAAPPVGAAAGNGASQPVKAAPSVRVLARKLGVDLARIKGTGPGGRILVSDLTPFTQDAPAAKALPPTDYGTPGTRRKLVGLRRAIAEHMVASKRTIPHYTYVDECDVSDLVKLRTGLRDVHLPQGLKITYLPFFVRTVVHALEECPARQCLAGRRRRGNRVTRQLRHRHRRRHARRTCRARDSRCGQVGPHGPGARDRAALHRRTGG